MTDSRQHHTAPPRPHGFAVLLCAAALLLGGAGLPSEVLPAAADGDRVALEPAAVRAPQGTAAVDLVVGSGAPGDVVVAFSLVAAVPGPAGEVERGEAVPDATVTRGGRVRPGERLRATVTTTVPTLLVAEVSPVGGSDGPATSLSALVLPGSAGAPPELTLEADGDDVTGRVAVTSPLLLSVRLRGEQAHTLSDRLVVPGGPLVVRGDPAPWLRPAELVVTDEAGRTVRVTAARERLVALAAGLLAVALAGIVVVRRRGG